MKNILLTIGLTLVFSILAAEYPYDGLRSNSNNKEGIQFVKHSWEEILQLAEEEDKLIFLDIYAKWCGPCKKLKATTFVDKEVGAYYNDKFINVSLDGERGEGLTLARKYAITAYPSLLFINEKGELLHLQYGYLNSKQFIRLGEVF